MGKRIYVGNLPFTSTEDELRDFFVNYSVTEVKIITDKDTGRPRGFAFVELDSDVAVQEAVAELDGTVLGGRTLKVNEAQERQGRGRGHERRDDRSDRGRGRRDDR
ncbi:MAG: hypothetical protein Q7J25_10245 [Vicinamibacterales bacterium]|nr:hypothetical protein [Vicinamibacterales bacterium]